MEATPTGCTLTLFGIEFSSFGILRHVGSYEVNTCGSHLPAVVAHLGISGFVDSIEGFVGALDSFFGLDDSLPGLLMLVTSLVGDIRVARSGATQAMEDFLSLAAVSLVSIHASLLLNLVIVTRHHVASLLAQRHWP